MPQNIRDKNPFKVPDNYFEEINSKILAAKEVRGEPLVIRHTSFRRYIAVAASIAALILIGYTAINLLGPSREMTGISGATYEDVSVLNINDDDLLSLEKSIYIPEFAEISSDISSNELIDNLLNEDVEITEIYERL